MTDNQGLLPNNVSITSDLLYDLKPSSGRGRSYRCSIQPTNKQTFSGGDTAILMIPCGRRGTFLDNQSSYIKYTIVNNEVALGKTAFLDNNGACVINRLDVFHASNMLESIQSYNTLYSYLLDFQLNVSQAYSLSNTFGTSYDYNRKGYPLGLSTGANKLTVCMPLLSGVVGLGLDKSLPVGSLNDDIRLEITFENNTQALCWSGTPATSYTIVGLELELTYIELADDSMNIVNSVSPLNDTVFLHGNSWRHYVSSIAANTAGTYSTLVPCRFASTKTLVLCPRRSTEITSASSYSLSSRSNFGIDSYWWRVGSALIPQKFITLKSSSGLVAGYGEGFLELQKSLHALNHAELSGNLPFTYYNVNDAVDATAGITAITTNTTADSFKNGFCIAQNLETYSQRNDVLINGLNTLSSQTFFECNIGTAPSNAYTLDFYANFDQILVKDQQGILSVRF